MIKYKNIITIFIYKLIWKLKYTFKIKYTNELFVSKRILEKNFKIDDSFNFIQIGANDGISFDFLYDFVVVRKSCGIVVEPINEYYNELVKNYDKFENIVKVNKAVHPTATQIEVFKINPSAKDNYPDWVKGIASLDPNHHKKIEIASKDIISEMVNAASLSNIIDTYYVGNTVNYFQIDTEGFDFEILKMIDFENMKPLIIKYESVNLSVRDKSAARQLLENQGYFVFDEIGDTVGINISKIKM